MMLFVSDYEVHLRSNVSICVAMRREFTFRGICCEELRNIPVLDKEMLYLNIKIYQCAFAEGDDMSDMSTGENGEIGEILKK